MAGFETDLTQCAASVCGRGGPEECGLREALLINPAGRPEPIDGEQYTTSTLSVFCVVARADDITLPIIRLNSAAFLVFFSLVS